MKSRVRELKENKGAVARGFLAAVAFLSLPFSAQASFEHLSVGARAAGMADAYTTTADDSAALYYNPAGLMHVKRPEVGTYYSRLFLGLDDKSEINRAFLGYVQPIKNRKQGVIGIGYVQMGLSGLYTESSIGLSYARGIKDRWNVGGTLKFLRKNYGSNLYTDNAINVDTGANLGAKDPVFASGNSKSAVAVDLGTQYRLAKNYALGLALRNVNQPSTAIKSGGDKAPAVYALGMSRWTRVSSLSLELANSKFANSQDTRLNFGGERWFRSGFGMRGGLSIGSREYRTLAFGGSYRMDGFQFDYALNYPLAGVDSTAGTHMVSMTFRFGKPEPDPIEAQLMNEREARLRAEAEMARLRQELMELTVDRPVEKDTRVVDDAAQDALKQAEQEVQRLKQQEPEPVRVAALPSAAAAARVPAPKPVAAVPVAPSKPRVAPDMLAQYSESLKFYSNQVKAGVPVSERIATLQRINEKYQGKGVDLGTVQTELKKLKGQDDKLTEDYKLSVSYYSRIVQQGTSAEERVLLLERIIKKYKPMGVDTGELEKELENLKKKR